MALLSGSATLRSQQGETAMRPSIFAHITVPGDAAYTSASGSAVETFLRAVLGHPVTPTMVTGYAVLTASPNAITHIVRFNPTTKAIFLNAVTDGAAQANADLSTYTLHLNVFGQ